MKKSEILGRRNVLSEQNFMLRQEQAVCEDFVDSYSKNRLWTRFSIGVIGLGITVGSIGFLPGMLIGASAMLVGAAMLTLPVIKAKQILKNTNQQDGLNIFNMTTKVSRHCAYLERVEEANKQEIALIDKDLVKDGNPTYSVKKEKYNTKFMEYNKSQIKGTEKTDIEK